MKNPSLPSESSDNDSITLLDTAHSPLTVEAAQEEEVNEESTAEPLRRRRPSTATQPTQPTIQPTFRLFWFAAVSMLPMAFLTLIYQQQQQQNQHAAQRQQQQQRERRRRLFLDESSDPPLWMWGKENDVSDVTVDEILMDRNHNNPGQDNGTASKIDKNDDNDKTKWLILGMGLPRTGSLALHEFLQCHGICSHHYCCPKDQPQGKQQQRVSFPCQPIDAEPEPSGSSSSSHDSSHTCGACLHQNLLQPTMTDDAGSKESSKHPLEGCGSCEQGNDNGNNHNNQNIQAYTQFDVESSHPSFSWFLPQHFALPLLMPRSPTTKAKAASSSTPNHDRLDQRQPQNVIWILTRRANATLWAQSVLHWYSHTRRLFHAFDLPYYYHDNNRTNETTSTTNDDETTTIGLTRPTTQADLFQELERAIERTNNVTEHLRRQALLEQVHQRHWDKVREFYKQRRRRPEAPLWHLVEVNVDHPQAGATLADDLNAILNGDDSLRPSCWNFNAAALNDDWKDFRLPF